MNGGLTRVRGDAALFRNKNNDSMITQLHFEVMICLWRARGRPTGAFRAPRDAGVVGGVVDAYKPGPGPLI